MSGDYESLFTSLTDTIEKFISVVKSKKSTLMATSEWSVKDELCHITFWHENYAVNYEALASKKVPPLPQDMSTINLAGVTYMRKFSVRELIKKLRLDNKSLYRSIVVKKIPRMTYSKGGKVYETGDFLEMITRHIVTHTKQIKYTKT